MTNAEIRAELDATRLALREAYADLSALRAALEDAQRDTVLALSDRLPVPSPAFSSTPRPASDATAPF